MDKSYVIAALSWSFPLGGQGTLSHSWQKIQLFTKATVSKARQELAALERIEEKDSYMESH